MFATHTGPGSAPSRRPIRRGKRALTFGIGLGLMVAPLSFIAAPAHAAEVDLTLLTINDFHGRIDANTTKFATTIETIRAAKGDANTLVVSGGDNIGASLFASAFAEDEPTVEVLNALEVGASAAGNHEFDRGFAWLKENLIDGTNPEFTPAEYAILGDNVRERATGDPAMEESYRTTVAGLDVCVAGSVTEETPTLVNPDGIAELTFGDPVAEVNRVVKEMEADAPCDVTVATYHEGAPDGTKTLVENTAASVAFDSIVNDTDASVDAIVTGHTHQTYAYDAPIPGGDATRPVIQTGSYGANVGQIDLTVDGGVVTAHTQQNVARAAAENLALPRVAEVKTIVDDALAKADVVGDVAIGTISDDITTAFSGGTYGPDGYQGGTRDDRASESTMGHLVADALRRTPIAGQPTPDIAVANSGGLRADLLYAGDLTTSPENTDGVVTFEEANAVLPFVNNISYVKMAGTDLKRLLEQQWQTNADGTIPSRPYLALGLSRNVRVTADEARPLGRRVTSVRINGDLLDAGATYTVATFSFLAAGGDNFRAFTDGVATDTGKIDRDLWIDGFFGNGRTKSPEFSRRQVFTDAPRKVRGGQQVTFEMTKLDLTSLGTLPNKALAVSLKQPGKPARYLDTFPVTAGSATVDLRMPARIAKGSILRLVTDVAGTKVKVRALPALRTEATIKAAVKPRTITVDWTRAKLVVKVKAQGVTPSGKVRIRVPGQGTTTGRLEQGTVVFKLDPFDHVGKKTVRIKYLGNALVKRATRTLTFRVTR